MKKYIFYIMLVFGLSLGACNDWLDVPSKTEVIDYEMFETEQGFMDGMAGVLPNDGRCLVRGYTEYDLSGCVGSAF